MPTYRWRGIDATGTTHRGKEYFESIERLERELFDRGIALLYARKTNSKQSMPEQVFASLLGNLATLLESDIPLASALPLAADSIPSRHRHIVQQLETEVRQGKQLATSITQHNVHISPVITQTIECGEKSGRLHEALQHIATLLLRKQMLSQELKRAAYGPIITTSFALLIAIALLLYIVPQLEPLVANNHVPHWSTKLLFKASRLLQREETRMFMVIGFTILFFSLRWARSKEAIKEAKSRIALKLPIVGRMVAKQNVVQYARTLAMLIKSGHPLAQSLPLAQRVCKNSVIAREASQAADGVNRGLSLSKALQSIEASHFPTSFVNLTQLGEQTGRLDHMLNKSADILEVELTQRIVICKTLFQPALLIGVGLGIAALLFSLYLPLFELFVETS